jgi:hypothetical protein
MRQEDRENNPLADLNWRVYESGVVLIPATLTNVSGQDFDRSLGITTLQITGPNGQVTNNLNGGFAIIRTLMGAHDGTGELPTIHGQAPAPADSVHEGYIYAIYDGDGYYIIQFSLRGYTTTLVVPVSR